MAFDLDANGQPINRRLNAARITDRGIDELIGLARGVLADGEVVKGEAEFLVAWLNTHRTVAEQWPACILYARLREMLSDDVLDLDEQAELIDMLMEMTGGGLPSTEDAESDSTSLPLCCPPPEIVFPDRLFCFTGKFIHGSRKECQAEVVSRGGSAKASPTRKTDYVVIGTVGSSDWIHSTHGRKIEKAVELRDDEGLQLSIVAEKHWVKFLG